MKGPHISVPLFVQTGILSSAHFCPLPLCKHVFHILGVYLQAISGVPCINATASRCNRGWMVERELNGFALDGLALPQESSSGGCLHLPRLGARRKDQHHLGPAEVGTQILAACMLDSPQKRLAKEAREAERLQKSLAKVGHALNWLLPCKCFQGQLCLAVNVACWIRVFLDRQFAKVDRTDGPVL